MEDSTLLSSSYTSLGDSLNIYSDIVKDAKTNKYVPQFELDRLLPFKGTFILYYNELMFYLCYWDHYYLTVYDRKIIDDEGKAKLIYEKSYGGIKFADPFGRNINGYVYSKDRVVIIIEDMTKIVVTVYDCKINSSIVVLEDNRYLFQYLACNDNGIFLRRSNMIHIFNVSDDMKVEHKNIDINIYKHLRWQHSTDSYIHATILNKDTMIIHSRQKIYTLDINKVVILYDMVQENVFDIKILNDEMYIVDMGSIYHVYYHTIDKPILLTSSKKNYEDIITLDNDPKYKIVNLCVLQSYLESYLCMDLIKELNNYLYT